MKKGIHPENYRPVVFKDMSNEDIFITRSTMPAKETIVVDGVEYPLIKVEISSTSHPFFTGKAKLVDTAGRVDRFMSRYGNRKKYSTPTHSPSGWREVQTPQEWHKLRSHLPDRGRWLRCFRKVCT